MLVDDTRNSGPSRDWFGSLDCTGQTETVLRLMTLIGLGVDEEAEGSLNSQDRYSTFKQGQHNRLMMNLTATGCQLIKEHLTPTVCMIRRTELQDGMR